MRERIQWIVIALLILMYSGVFAANNLLPISQSVFAGIALAGTGMLILTQIGAIWQILSKSRLLVIFLLFVGSSIVWSINPDASIRQYVVLIGASALGVYIASQYTLTQQTYFYVRLLIVVTVASFLVIVLLPQNGIHQEAFHFGRWRGITLHKNILGEWMSLAAAMLLFLPDDLLRLPRSVKYSIGILAMVILVLTVSVTSIVSFSLIVILYPVIVILQQDFRLKVAMLLYFLAGVIVATVFISLNFSDFVVQIGRSPTLTERSIIWPIVLSLVAERPFVGYGYMSFFIPESYWLGTGFEDFLWRPAHAHNTWLDLLMDFGVVGLVMFVMLILRGLQYAYVAYVQHHRAEILLFVLLILNILTRSMTETLAIRRQDIIWIMFISLLARLYWDAQTQSQSADTAHTPHAGSPLD